MSLPAPTPGSDEAIVQEYAALYPPLISFKQAAEIAQRPLKTIYDWSSRQHFDGFKQKVGREVRLRRDPYISWKLRSGN